MRAKSQAQRRWAFGVMGEAWARKHDYDNKGPLPKRLGKKKAAKKKRKKATSKKRKPARKKARRSR